MKQRLKIVKRRLLSFCTAYTIIVLGACLWNIIIANGGSLSTTGLLGMAGVLLFVCGIDYLLSFYIENVALFLLVDSICVLIVCLPSALYFQWIAPKLTSICCCSMLCLGALFFNYFLFDRKLRVKAAKINFILQRNRESEGENNATTE